MGHLFALAGRTTRTEKKHCTTSFSDIGPGVRVAGAQWPFHQKSRPHPAVHPGRALVLEQVSGDHLRADRRS